MIIHQNFVLAPLLWYKIGGRAKYLLECTNREDILQAVDFITTKNIAKVFVCGLGSNLIFTDDDFDGAVIRIIKGGQGTRDKRQVGKITEDGFVEAFAGEILGNVIDFGFENALIGLEWAGGLPGTVGAGVRGNVGAFGGEIKDSLVSAEVLDYSSKNPVIKTISNEGMHFVYRGSMVKTHKKMIVVSAKFSLYQANHEMLAAAMEICERNKQYRRDRHPLEYPNCGSVFKNIREKEQVEKILSVYPDLQEQVEKKWYGKVAVAALIERLGMKGYQVGNAQVSEKHALFIVNKGHARAKDVLRIIHDIQQKFQETFGFQLETEVEIVK